MPATWQAGDTAPPIRFIITDDGEPLDPDLTVKFRFGPKGQQATFERDCETDEEDEAKGATCHCDWEVGDLAESGDYEGQLVVLYPPGEGEEDDKPRLSPPFEILVARSVPAPPEPEP